LARGGGKEIASAFEKKIKLLQNLFLIISVVKIFRRRQPSAVSRR
jgi:hypothetical protein